MVQTVKKIAAYHQFYAVSQRLSPRSRLRQPDTEKVAQCGIRAQRQIVVNVFLLKNLSWLSIIPRIVLHRNDLDDQLFDTLAASTQLLRQAPVRGKP